MNFRLTAILFGTVFVVAVILLILSFTDGDSPPTDLLAEELAAVKAEDVGVVEIERDPGGKIKLVRGKDGKRWDVTEPYQARADAAAVNEVVNALLKAKPTAYQGLTGDPAAHGLQPPGLRVTLRSGERASTVNLGDVTIGGSKGVVFVTTSARPKRPMAVPRQSVDALFRDNSASSSGKAGDLAKTVGDYRDKAVFPTDGLGGSDEVVGVVLTAKGKSLSLAKSGTGWKFLNPPSWGEADPVGDPAASPGTFTGVRPLLSTLTNLRAQGAADFVENPTPQQLAEWGLADGSPDRVKVDLALQNGEKTTAYVGKREATPPTPPQTPGAPPPPPQTGKVWVKVEGQTGVMKAQGGDLIGLAGVVENPDPLRDRNLLALEKNRIDGLDLANGAAKLRKTGGALGQWKLYGNAAAGDPSPVSITEVERVLNLLTEKRTIKSFPPPNEANFGPDRVEVKVWADGFEPPTEPKKDAKPDPAAEPKQKNPPVTLVFGKRESDSVHVKRILPDGKTTDYFLMPEKVKVGAAPEPADLTAAVTKSRLDLLDKDLKGFATSSVGKLVVQGAVTFDLDRDDKDASAGGTGWKFAADAKGPAGQVYKKGDSADAQTVQGMLDILATTPTVTRFVDEAPTDAKLEEYALGKNLRLRVTVGLKGGFDPDDKERVYEFGNETADPNFVYARQKGRKAVFTLPKFMVEKFTTADLRNRAIFRVNPAEVAKIEIKGWGSVFGSPAEVSVEKNKEGVWAATKSPTNIAADPAKVAAFLNALNSLQVKAFTADTAMEPRHGLLDDKQVFVVTLYKPDGGHYLHLRLGGPTEPNGTTLYAFTNRLPDGKPIVTVEAAALKPYRDAPASLAR